jgi:hypothetical protein
VFDVFVDTFFEVVSVFKYKLARHDDETLVRSAVESLETTIEKLG